MSQPQSPQPRMLMPFVDLKAQFASIREEVMAADFREYQPPGYRRPPGFRGLKTALICRNAYRAYAMLGPVNNARVMARRALAGAG